MPWQNPQQLATAEMNFEGWKLKYKFFKSVTSANICLDEDVFIKTNIFTNISRRLQKTSSFQDVFIETNVCWDYIKLSHVSLVLLIQLCNRPCSHYTVWLFVAPPIAYRMGLLFTLETNIWAHFLYRIAVETLCSSKWYITKRYLQRSDFLYNFSNVNRISY